MSPPPLTLAQKEAAQQVLFSRGVTTVYNEDQRDFNTDIECSDLGNITTRLLTVRDKTRRDHVTRDASPACG